MRSQSRPAPANVALSLISLARPGRRALGTATRASTADTIAHLESAQNWERRFDQSCGGQADWSDAPALRKGGAGRVTAKLRAK